MGKLEREAIDNDFNFTLGHYFYAFSLYKRGELSEKRFLCALNKLLFYSSFMRATIAKDYVKYYMEFIKSAFLFKRINKECYEKFKDRIDLLVLLMYFSLAPFSEEVEVQVHGCTVCFPLGNLWFAVLSSKPKILSQKILYPEQKYYVIKYMIEQNDFVTNGTITSDFYYSTLSDGLEGIRFRHPLNFFAVRVFKSFRDLQKELVFNNGIIF